MINKYHLYQYGRAQQDYEDYQQNHKTALETMEDCEEMLHPWTPRDHRVLNMHDRGGHTVNPYRFERDLVDPISWVYVYDNNHPGNPNMKVRFDTSFSYWEYTGFPSPWEGNMFIYLSDHISTYTTNPLLSGSIPPQNNWITTEIGEVSERVEFYVQSTDTVIFQSPAGIIGHMGDSLFSTLSEGHPIIPKDGFETPPIGYYLPNDTWTCQFSGLKDSVLRFSLFTDSTVMVYWRTDVDSTQTEKLRYPGNDSTLLILNPDIESRSYNLDALCAAPDSDIFYSIQNISIDNADSGRYSIRPESRLQLDNYGGEKPYDLHIQIANSNEELFFLHEEIPLPSNSSHLIVPDWRPYNDSVMILVDSGMVGTFSDTILVGNDFFVRGDANRDGVINAADVVYLINYLYIHGPAPTPLAAGDVNCDGTINAADVVYLINYLYIHGPAPAC
jgi:hypothetical protein